MSRWLTRWRRRLFVLLAWLTLMVIRAALARFGYRRVYQRLLAWSPRPTATTDVRRCLVTARLVNRAALLPPREAATCLHRSLALWWLLRFRRLDSDIRTGVRRSDSGWDVHAWVEHDGVVINDDPTKVAGYRLLDDWLQQAGALSGVSS
ncbi:MAG: lasso peptide biosynthesis B2 protein [Xanthomonadales bacterium]|nr:lasso peptide biosynthesis B2 protein [Xanthomonadales bacterium]